MTTATAVADTPATSRRVRLVLALIAALAAASYAWGMASQTPELYYAAAVRSMSMSWHNFFFAAFDPAATVSIDKLPGAFWLQALSVKVFGPHVWAMILPQVIEGVLTILLLFRVVRRLSGPAAALGAAAIAACMPATVALDRGNISDTLLILMLLLAADLTVTAAQRNSGRHLVFAGVVVGVAFQAKMVQAWLILPVLAAVWWSTADRSQWRARSAWTLAMGAAAAVVSLSWMAVVSVIPTSNRPYVDGSHHNSLLEQVFRYNAASRGTGSVDVGAANLQVGNGKSLRQLLVLGPDNRFDHVLSGGGGRMIGWLVPLAVVVLVWLGVRAWRRRDTRPMALTLWGSWAIAHLVVFLVVGTVNSYYLAALTPPIAALIAMGAVEVARTAGVRMLIVATLLVVASIGYGWWLLEPAPPAARWTATGIALVLCALAATLRGGRAASALLVAVAIAPVVASVSIVWENEGPLDTPFEPAAARDVTKTFMGDATDTAAPLVEKMQRTQGPGVYPLATYTSTIASPFVFATGAEILPIGGFTGTAPSPTVDELAQIVAAGRVHLVLVTPSGDDRVVWVRTHCRPLESSGSVSGILPYFCGKLSPNRP